MVAAVKRTLNLPGAKLIMAFASVYLVWGSTYLAIRFAIESIPTFLMAGSRFLISGILVYIYLRIRGRAKPTLKEWKIESFVGLLLLALANGSVVMAEHTVPSGLAALMVATVSLWMVLLNWLWNKTERPNFGIVSGIVIGFVGLIILVDPQNISGGTSVDPFGAFLLLFAAFMWAAGSVYSKTAHHPKSPMISASMQMISGGIFLLLFSALNGEFSDLNLSLVSVKSSLSLGYLIFFGSIIGFGSYVYILRHASPAHVSTYAYVNPVIAVLLGWFFADEIVDERILIAATFIIFSVILITKFRNGKKELADHDIPKTTE
ncbi:drug/metabolite exporter YedA [Candidatus Marinimicrobia bacterium MT.SAG.3]|nr:drug/metabolite exporter YedA [Candidatus Neomarinimicrobiota bacterium]MCH8300102.1 drug/metabolite exporter YedA [Candidatus Neomarinimicrobiota bacterium]TFB10434.1 drug/metabolite exporter YedA [Candidatus Marinimicrobia bacterium MT.SAG.3]